MEYLQALGEQQQQGQKQGGGGSGAPKGTAAKAQGGAAERRESTLCSAQTALSGLSHSVQSGPQQQQQRRWAAAERTERSGQHVPRGDRAPALSSCVSDSAQATLSACTTTQGEGVGFSCVLYAV